MRDSESGGRGKSNPRPDQRSGGAGDALGKQLLDTASAAIFERDVCDEVLSGLAPRQDAGQRHDRATLAWKVEDYLRKHMGEAISVRDLCRITGSAERTLHMAFREEIGSTPKAYLKVLLLNAARRDLRAAPNGTTVTEVAIRWGFTHLGWFAHDYKGMFGESPHDTLQGRHAPAHGLPHPAHPHSPAILRLAENARSGDAFAVFG